jgi:hypothetical protein
MTEEGRDQIMGIVSAPANLAKLGFYQEVAKQCALGQIDESLARQLSEEGKAVIWIDGGLHATEVLCAQVLIETLYQMVSRNDPETMRILNDVIILFVHANPDGMDLCADWYMRNKDPQKRSLTGLPVLYEKYAGHDNNRDFYAANLRETQNMNRVMYREWFPQVVYNHHQTGPAGAVMFIPPCRDPYNYNIDPMVIGGIEAVSTAVVLRSLEENKPGVTVRTGARYSTWFNGGLSTACQFHNMIGLFTETIGSPTPSQVPLIASKQLPNSDYLLPIRPQPWHFRQSVDYSVTANKAFLDYASRNRQHLLFNIWRMGRNAIEAGNRDNWTITPRMVAAAGGGRAAGGERGQGRGAGGRAAFAGLGRGGRGGANAVAEYNKFFRDPAKRDPRGFILPSDQADFLTATKFVNKLINSGVSVLQATAPFTVAGKKYPTGSYVVKSAQAFRPHIMDMFEPQDHPDDFAAGSKTPTAPYDMAGWTLAFQMGVKFDRVLEAINGPFEELKDDVPTPAVQLAKAPKDVGYFLDPRVNDSYRAVNKLLGEGEQVARLKQAFTSNGATFGAGSFFVKRGENTTARLEEISKTLGVRAQGSSTAPEKEAVVLKPVRVGLWDRYGGSMPSGWARQILEQFEYPHKVVFAPELDKGNLESKFDVLILVDGAISGRGGAGGGRGGAAGGPGGRGGRGNAGGAPGGRGASGAGGAGGDAAGGAGRAGAGGGNPASTGANAEAGRESGIPEQYRGRQGSITTGTTIPQLKKFLEAGGTIITIGGSTSLAKQLGLPLNNHLSEKVDGEEQALNREKFYVPGSVLQASVDNTKPLAWGLDDRVDVMFEGSPTFKIPADAKGLERVAWYDSKTPLRSGWAWGQERLKDGVAIATAPVGKGTLILCGPQILFRGQPHGSFKFLFNGIVQASAKQ